MAQQPYMGLGLLFPRLCGLRICGSSETSRLAALFNSILMCEKWLEFSLRTLLVLLHARRFFYMP
jgi:hypothetical protein